MLLVIAILVLALVVGLGLRDRLAATSRDLVAGLRSRRRPARSAQGNPVMTPEKIEAARKLADAGLGNAEIARRIGVSRTSVHRYVSGDHADVEAA